MNLELDEAGMTFLVGAFVILAAEAIAHYLFGRSLLRFFQGRFGLTDEGDERPGLTTGVFVGLSFALGLLVEDVCYKYSDPYVFWTYHVTHPEQFVASHSHETDDIKATLQQSVLVSDIDKLPPELTNLGGEVFGSGIFAKLNGSKGVEVEDWAQPSVATEAKPYNRGEKELRRIISGTFYFAKNRVYHVATYFEEMRRIQSRLEFSSTVATVSLISSVTCVTFAIIWIPLVWKAAEIRQRLLFRVGALLGVFVTVYSLAFLAYIQESEEFNRRVFGYYDSMVRATRTASTPSGATPITILP